MRKNRRWSALLLLSLIALGPLAGCKSEEEKQKEAEQDDIDSILGQVQTAKLSELDLTKEMSTELGRRMQSLLIEAREIENEYFANVDKFQPQNYSTGLALSDQSKRDAYRTMIEQLKVDLAQYGTDHSVYMDKVHELVKEQDGEDAPDPGITLRFGMKAYLQSVNELADAHLAVVAHCDKFKPHVGADGLVEFDKPSDDDAYQQLILALSDAELSVEHALAFIEQTKRSLAAVSGQD